MRFFFLEYTNLTNLSRLITFLIHLNDENISKNHIESYLALTLMIHIHRNIWILTWQAWYYIQGVQKQFPPSWSKAGKTSKQFWDQKQRRCVPSQHKKPQARSGQSAAVSSGQTPAKQNRRQEEHPGEHHCRTAGSELHSWAEDCSERVAQCRELGENCTQALALWFSKDGHSRDKAVY